MPAAPMAAAMTTPALNRDMNVVMALTVSRFARQSGRAAWRLARIGRVFQSVGVGEQLIFAEVEAEQLGPDRNTLGRSGGRCRESCLKGDRRKARTIRQR